METIHWKSLFPHIPADFTSGGRQNFPFVRLTATEEAAIVEFSNMNLPGFIARDVVVWMAIARGTLKPQGEEEVFIRPVSKGDVIKRGFTNQPQNSLLVIDFNRAPKDSVISFEKWYQLDPGYRGVSPRFFFPRDPIFLPDLGRYGDDEIVGYEFYLKRGLVAEVTGVVEVHKYAEDGMSIGDSDIWGILKPFNGKNVRITLEEVL
jgi:hypothetical protein